MWNESVRLLDPLFPFALSTTARFLFLSSTFFCFSLWFPLTHWICRQTRPFSAVFPLLMYKAIRRRRPNQRCFVCKRLPSLFFFFCYRDPLRWSMPGKTTLNDGWWWGWFSACGSLRPVAITARKRERARCNEENIESKRLSHFFFVLWFYLFLYFLFPSRSPKKMILSRNSLYTQTQKTPRKKGAIAA